MSRKTIVKFIITILTQVKTLFLITVFTYSQKTSTSYVNKSLLSNYFLILDFFYLLEISRKYKVESMKTVKSSLSNKYF